MEHNDCGSVAGYCWHYNRRYHRARFEMATTSAIWVGSTDVEDLERVTPTK